MAPLQSGCEAVITNRNREELLTQLFVVEAPITAFGRSRVLMSNKIHVSGEVVQDFASCKSKARAHL